MMYCKVKINQSSSIPQSPGKPGGSSSADGKIAQLEAQKAKLEQQVKDALKEEDPQAQAKAAACRVQQPAKQWFGIRARRTVPVNAGLFADQGADLTITDNGVGIHGDFSFWKPVAECPDALLISEVQNG